MDNIPFKELSGNARPARQAVIVKLAKMGLPAKEIEKQALCSKKARQNTIKKYKETGHYDDAPRSGRPLKHTEEDDRELTRSIDRCESESAIEAAAYYNSVCPEDQHLCERTVARILSKSGRPGRAKPRKSSLTPQMIRDWLHWAHTMKRRVEHGELDWHMTVFTDESKFNCQGSEGRTWYRKQACAPLQPCHIKPRFQSGGFKVFCYGAISWYGVSELVFLPIEKVAGRQVTAKGSTLEQWVKEVLHPAWDQWSQRAGFPMEIVHDKDKKAWTQANKNQHDEFGMEFLEWPGNSPDMNCIEWAWGYIAKRLKDRAKYPHLPKSQQELQERVQKEWDAIDLIKVQEWIRSMPERIDALIAAKGMHTKY